MLTIQLDDFLDDGIIKEKSFKKLIKYLDWQKYKNKKVLIRGCSNAPIPTWAFLIITHRLTINNAKIYFGEKCSAIKIH